VAATGQYSGQQLTRFAQHRGLRSRRGLVLNKDTVCDTILRNPAYYGTFRWGGKIYDGNYEPLISKDLYDRVQLALEERSGLRSWSDELGNLSVTISDLRWMAGVELLKNMVRPARFERATFSSGG
jgi:Recombinase